MSEYKINKYTFKLSQNNLSENKKELYQKKLNMYKNFQKGGVMYMKHINDLVIFIKHYVGTLDNGQIINKIKLDKNSKVQLIYKKDTYSNDSVISIEQIEEELPNAIMEEFKSILNVIQYDVIENNIYSISILPSGAIDITFNLSRHSQQPPPEKYTISVDDEEQIKNKLIKKIRIHAKEQQRQSEQQRLFEQQRLEQGYQLEQQKQQQIQTQLPFQTQVSTYVPPQFAYAYY